MLDVYPRLFQRTLWPLMNVATGRSIHRKLRFLEQSQWWARDRLEALQLAKLQRLLAHVYDTVPFYAREMRGVGLHPSDVTSLEILRRMPVVTKAIVQASPGEFLARGMRLQRLVAGSTGGSTNEPTTFYRSREQDSWHWALKYRMWGMAGYRLGLRYVNVYNMRRLGLVKRLQDCLLRNHDYYVFSCARQERMLADALTVLARPNVCFLAGCTTTVRILADYRASLGSRLPIHLRAVLTTGSLLTSRDRQVIEASLEAPVWDHYGLGGEGAHVAAECEHKQGYHVNVENLVVEPADERCVDTGQSTGVLVTVLDNLDWPLIRYVTGDEAVFTRRACACGRGLCLLDRIDGRVSDVLRLPNGVRLNTHYFSVLLADAARVAQYQVEQTARHALLFRMIWRGGPPCEDLKERLRCEVRGISDGTVRVSFEDVDAIPTLRSGKHRYIIALSEDVA